MSEWKKVSTVSERMRIAMSLCKKRQTDLAEETGIAKGTISNYINGRYEPKAPAIAKIAKALNVSEMWLWGYDVPMERHAYADPSDAEFLDSLPSLHPKQELPPELSALNVLLAISGRQIMKCNGEYFLDECGLLTEDEVNELLNNIVMAAKTAVDVMTAKKTKDFRDFIKGERK